MDKFFVGENVFVSSDCYIGIKNQEGVFLGRAVKFDGEEHPNLFSVRIIGGASDDLVLSFTEDEIGYA